MEHSRHSLLIPPQDIYRMGRNATRASNFLKSLGHEYRLMILFHLAEGEKTVKELEHLLSARQASVSQHLGRLRLEGLIHARREGKFVHYRLAGDRPLRALRIVLELFLEEDTRHRI